MDFVAAAVLFGALFAGSACLEEVFAKENVDVFRLMVVMYIFFVCLVGPLLQPAMEVAMYVCHMACDPVVCRDAPERVERHLREMIRIPRSTYNYTAAG